MRLSVLALSLSGLFVALPAAAQDYAARDVGSWTVAGSADEQGCFLTRTYDGPGATTVLLGVDIDDTNHLSVLNDNWSIRPKDPLRLEFRLSNGGYAGHGAVGILSQGKPGFVATFEPKFPGYFAASKVLEIYRGKVPVEKLPLDGSGAAIAELRQCVALYRDRAAASARPNVPRDPFAPSAKRKSRRK